MTVYGVSSQLTPFIGRDDELAKIAALLVDPTCRLLSLLGPGGTGKTRLALEAAQRADTAGAFPGGVYFAGLQSVSSPDVLVPAIAGALDFAFFGGGVPKQQLLDFLREKRLLLVLDNFEHLLDGAPLVSEILAYAPGVRVLATSRERLNLVEEWVLEVGGLPFPHPGIATQAESYSAVQLFTQTARRAQVNFDLNRELQIVARICRAVDGMPLAIELAAAWVRTLPCITIAEEIERGLDLLQTTARNVPERHRNVRAVLEHSWVLLADTEQTTFMQLSVFRGSFTREAAAAVAGATVLTLAALVDKSMLRVEVTGRYSLHELLRQYGAGKLAATDDQQTTEARHAHFYADWLFQRLGDLQGKRQLAALDEIEIDFDNIRAAVQWVALAHDADRLARCADSLYLFCEARSRFQEGAELFRQAEQQLSSAPERLDVVGRLVVRRLRLWVLSSLPVQDDIRLEAEVWLVRARQKDDRTEIAFCLGTLGEIALDARDYRTAKTTFEESLAVYTELTGQFFAARTIQKIGMCHVILGDNESFVRCAQDGFERSQALGDRIGMANCLYNLGSAAGWVEDNPEEEFYYREALALRREIGDKASLSMNLSGLGTGAFIRGDSREARVCAEEALSIAQDINHRDSIGFALSVLCLAAGLDENYALGWQLAEQARPLTVDSARLCNVDCGLMMAACGLGDFETARACCKRLITNETLTNFRWAKRRALPGYALCFAHEGQSERALELVAMIARDAAEIVIWAFHWPLFARLRAQLESAMSPAQAAAMWAHGENMDWDTLMTSLLNETEPIAAQSPRQLLADPLSERELDVLRLMADGLTNADIADQLVIGGSTVKKHINHIFSKLGAENRVQAIQRAGQLRLL